MGAELLLKKTRASYELKHINEMRTVANNYRVMQMLSREVKSIEEEIKELDKVTLEFSRLTSILNVKRSEYFGAISGFEEAVKTYIYSINNKEHYLWYLYETNTNGETRDLFKDIISESTKKEKVVNFNGIVVPEKKYYNNDSTSDMDKLKHFRQISKQYFRYYAKYITLCIDNEKEARLNLVDKLMVKKYKKD
jgi:hypothetical protein